MELSCSNIKEFLIFSYAPGNGNFEKYSLYLRKRKPKLKKIIILQETKAAKKFLTFCQKKAVLIFQEMENPKKFLIFSQKKACTLENGNPEKILYISGGTSKAPKTKISYISPKRVFLKTL